MDAEGMEDQGLSSMFGPPKVLLATLFGTVLVCMVILVWAAGGFGGATVSTQLTSTSNGLITLLPYLGAIVASGFFFIAWETRRK